ncbi:hypothetical protein SAMN06265222_1121 [Neorhodopirellula lusitana]|uniref:Transposase n=1 Tax=Neorhodopirellula lusitana TaxID=445327 RepID=A0ABY1QFA6_9BACT|nr:hypothetical protein SAMN06265222_1121 [Neorhodopirellula lusitana]
MERNLKGRLSKRYWGELSRPFTRLRSAQQIDAAEEVFGELEALLKPINTKAYRSRHEAGDDQVELHRMDVPSTLYRSLLSTNAIENSFLNTCRKLRLVTQFRDRGRPSESLAPARAAGRRGKYPPNSGHASLPALITAPAQPPANPA